LVLFYAVCSPVLADFVRYSCRPVRLVSPCAAEFVSSPCPIRVHSVASPHEAKPPDGEAGGRRYNDRMCSEELDRIEPPGAFRGDSGSRSQRLVAESGGKFRQVSAGPKNAGCATFAVDDGCSHALRLGGQDHVSIECLRRRGYMSGVSRVGPQFSRPAHRSGVQRQKEQPTRKEVQPPKAPHLPRPN
jgi:hypothetical protein